MSNEFIDKLITEIIDKTVFMTVIYLLHQYMWH